MYLVSKSSNIENRIYWVLKHDFCILDLLINHFLKNEGIVSQMTGMSWTITVKAYFPYAYHDCLLSIVFLIRKFVKKLSQKVDSIYQVFLKGNVCKSKKQFAFFIYQRLYYYFHHLLHLLRNWYRKMYKFLFISK